MVKRLLFIFVLFLQFCNGLLAQARSPFDSLVNVLEKNNSVKIFYDKKQTADLEIANVTGSLDSILSRLFAGTEFSYYKDNKSRVFITKGFSLSPALPKDFFSPRLPGNRLDTTINELPETVVAATADNIVYTVGSKGGAGTTAVISGYVRDSRSGEPLIGTTVSVEGARTVSTDGFGFYSITVPKGRHVLKMSYVGMKEISRQINVLSSGKVNIEMKEDVRSLKSAVIVAQKQSNVRGMQMGVERLNIKTIKQIPAIFGETDLMRAMLTLPGVTSVGEGTAGYNVRGGATDQNLVLLNDMTLYNPTHLFGFFSAVDPELVRGLELYKSAIPEKFGGRISSIMDVSTRDGNSKKLTGTAGLGPVTSKFTLEGPLGSEKTTFLTGGRITYSDWLLKQIPDPAFENSKASFYDAMLHFSHIFSDKDRIFFSGYTSGDKFRLNSDSTYAYTNLNFSVKWKHNFTNKFYSVLSTGMNKYDYTVQGRNNPKDAFNIKFGVKQFDVKADFKYAPNNKHDIDFGIQHLIYNLKPGEIIPLDSASIVKPVSVESEKGTETSVYLGDQYGLTNNLSVQVGLRYSYYRYLGPQKIYEYAAGQPRNESTVVDSAEYGKGETIQAYHGPEFRISAKYLLGAKSSLKFSYNTLRQYIHMITNTTAISPTDIWKLSDQYVKPQIGQQVSLGFYTNPGKKSIEISVEAYYKLSKNNLDYKSGAKLILNDAIERDVINTKGKAYGIEFLFKKLSGKLNGWISYTYSRTFLKVDDPNAGETINKGDYYPANYDKPHNASLVGNYRFTQRFSISLTSTYSTGRPITMPIGTFDMGGAPRVYYSERNAYRIPDYFRTDFSMTLEGNHKLKQKIHSSWTFGVYNLTGRDNPYSVYFALENGEIKGYQLSVFSTAIPFISFNLRF
ncbi:TonB-dependent receptor [Flavihumibacter profundi]|uniref:TonB-dependent receptor n=1 Tax=Flavihumibacter profundi TaxID=2716883 RepID=UPI001CC5B11A|nr:TonB-dependent receptor [Flavihumibacter profundi]MBZ5858708.1 TonB-dependent receptor [Flavihumibacter profundi]